MKFWLALALTVGGLAQDRETIVAEHLAADIRNRTKPASDALQEYVRSVAAKIGPIPVETVDDLPSVQWVPGRVFVPASLVNIARNEAELAAVIAHAMAHRSQQISNVVLIGEGLGIAEEERADRSAIEALAAAGYNPAAMADYLAHTIPHNVRRIEAARADLPQRAEWIVNTSEFERFRERARPPRKAPSLYLQK